MTHALEDLKTALGDRYRIVREVGRGGMATVYLAEDLKHHRQVAVKVLLPELTAALGHERFLREIEISAGLSHPHVLPLYDSGEAGGFLYSVTPYVEGESLRDRLDRERQLSIDEALRLGREVADALSYAHSRGIIHRDIKPENILLQSGHAVVADFGVARAVHAAGGERLTGTGVVVGTPAYMSPEQAAGDQDLDGRSDLYSLGCVLYEMLAGRPPFSGPTTESLVRQHLVAEAPAITSIRPAVRAEIAAALQRSLAKNPADRFNPVGQFAQALTLPGGSATKETPARGRRSLRVALVVAGVVLLALAVLQVWDDGGAPIPTMGRTVQVTRDPGLEVDPALSPDGQMIAFAAGPPTGMQIHVGAVSGGRTVALTDEPGNHRWPRWSPDGAEVAYQAPDGVYVVPRLGGAARLVVRLPEIATPFSPGAFTPLSGLAWGPHGRRIAFSGNYGAEGLYVAQVDGAGGPPIRLRAPREPHSPAWSPDGMKLAVASGNAIFGFGGAYFGNAGQSSIWVVPVDGDEPVRVTGDDHLDTSPVWSPDGRHLLWVSDRGGSRDIYRVRVDDGGAPAGDPVRLTTGLDVHTIHLTPDGRRLAYSNFRTLSNVWSMPIPRDGPVSIELARPVTTGNQTIEDVDVTADGQWLVFDSDRGGNADIYRMRVGTEEAMRLTTHPAGDYGAFWSPDGTRVGFHSLRAGNRDVFTVAADGTDLRQITSSLAHELDADWSPDGHALVAEIIDAEGMTLEAFIVVPLESGEEGARRLQAQGDFAVWSPDGGLILYHALDGLRVIPPDGGESRLIVSNEVDGSEAFYAAWSPDGRTLYYLARGEDGWMIRSVPREGGRGRILVRFDDASRQQSRYGFATDGRTFYFTLGSHESDVWVVELEER